MSTPESQWASHWLDSVAYGSNTMSQRKVASIDKRGGGLKAVKAVAQKEGVHLAFLADDKGNELVAASTRPFKVACSGAKPGMVDARGLIPHPSNRGRDGRPIAGCPFPQRLRNEVHAFGNQGKD
jgi:hypothetical protein